jgi:alpha-mannosidase
MEGKDLLVRVFNAAGDDQPDRLQTGFRADEAWLEELDGRKVKRLDMEGVKPELRRAVLLTIPRYGVRTIRFINARI